MKHTTKLYVGGAERDDELAAITFRTLRELLAATGCQRASRDLEEALIEAPDDVRYVFVNPFISEIDGEEVLEFAETFDAAATEYDELCNDI